MTCLQEFTVELGEKHMVVRRPSTRTGIGKGNYVARQPIREFTAKSRRRFLLTLDRISGLTTELTLTYPGDFAVDIRTTKQHLEAMKKWLLRQGVGGMWVLEWQERGAPHFHILLNGRVSPKAVSEAWYRIVGSGDARHLKAGTSVRSNPDRHRVGRYLAKHDQKEVPPECENVGRFWGRFGVKPEATVVTGPRDYVAPIVRTARKLVNARRKCHGIPKKRDEGRYGKTFWGVADTVRQFIASTCGGGAEYHRTQSRDAIMRYGDCQTHPHSRSLCFAITTAGTVSATG